MSVHSINLPEYLYSQLEMRVKQATNSVEEFIIEALVQIVSTAEKHSLPADVESELRAIASLSDETLWLITKAKTSPDKRRMNEELVHKNYNARN